jgi:hypothetical protein
MVLTADQQRVKSLLTETVTLLCKNGLHFQSEFSIEGLIGITLDHQDVFLVSIKETIQAAGHQHIRVDSGIDSCSDEKLRFACDQPMGTMRKQRQTNLANSSRLQDGRRMGGSPAGAFSTRHPSSLGAQVVAQKPTGSPVMQATCDQKQTQSSSNLKLESVSEDNHRQSDDATSITATASPVVAKSNLTFSADTPYQVNSNVENVCTTDSSECGDSSVEPSRKRRRASETITTSDIGDDNRQSENASILKLSAQSTPTRQNVDDCDVIHIKEETLDEGNDDDQVGTMSRAEEYMAYLAMCGSQVASNHAYQAPESSKVSTSHAVPARHASVGDFEDSSRDRGSWTSRSLSLGSASQVRDCDCFIFWSCFRAERDSTNPRR